MQWKHYNNIALILNEVKSLRLEQTSTVVFCVIYMTPHAIYYNMSFDYIASLLNVSSPVITMGDLNLPDIDWPS